MTIIKKTPSLGLFFLGVGGWVYGRRLLARRRAAREALEAGEGDDTGKQGEA